MKLNICLCLMADEMLLKDNKVWDKISIKMRKEFESKSEIYLKN